ncbi:transglycosylase family protein [Streptomyces zingiberis]|uniref:transglycosylase family protein n=1 Tax=Streptomyces zingiberis TaxID=2053010 RepID=UPI0019D0E451|nr:transglycosylase family protein [Streptomyces zingiberis]
MRSGNGRHRRPRQAPAIFVTAGVTGAGIAIPLLAATGAQAASGATWDKVAECESGGLWSADTGNGRYGGLQFSQEAWERYGGLNYAPSADQASRNAQIAVAEKQLAAEGPGAWSGCATSAGLVKGDKSSGKDGSTGLVGGLLGGLLNGGSSSASPEPTQEPGGSPSASPEDSDGLLGGVIEVGPSPSASPSGSPSAGAGKHRGQAADEEKAQETRERDADRSSGRHAARDGASAAKPDRGTEGSDTERPGPYALVPDSVFAGAADDRSDSGAWTYSANAMNWSAGTSG